MEGIEYLEGEIQGLSTSSTIHGTALYYHYIAIQTAQGREQLKRATVPKTLAPHLRIGFRGKLHYLIASDRTPLVYALEGVEHGTVAAVEEAHTIAQQIRLFYIKAGVVLILAALVIAAIALAMHATPFMVMFGVPPMTVGVIQAYAGLATRIAVPDAADMNRALRLE